MTRSLRAIYVDGVLKPLEPLSLRDHQEVTLTLSDEDGKWADSALLRELEQYADDSVTLEQVRSALAKIPGSMAADFRAERDERS